MRRAVALCSLGSVLLLLQPAGHAAPGDALPFFTSYTVTGNYAVAGIDLLPQNATVDPGTGLKFVTGTIEMSGVPANADIIAAWLYWETIWNGLDETQLDGALFRGQPVTAVRSSAVGLNGPYSPCWSGGGTSMLTMSRADVRRLLPPQLDEAGMPTGRRVVNHADLQKYQKQFPNDNWFLTVTLPEAGTGNQLPQSAGATLVVIYRDPDPNPGASPPVTATDLRTVVVYDGAHVQAQGETMQQTIRGFLQSKELGADARITHIAGSGSPNDTDQIWFSTSTGSLGSVLGTNQFVKAGGGASDRAWSNPTFPNPSSPAALPMPGEDSGVYGEQVKTTVTHTSDTPYDCLSWAAVVFSTKVQDAEPGGGDGLVDDLERGLEDGSGFLNPAGLPYPEIHHMGASPEQRDLFVEIGAMFDPAGHNHMPSEAVLKIVGEAFLNPPEGHDPIYVHFDVGDSGYANPPENPYLFVPAVPANLARGGELIEEKACTSPYPDCRFPGHAGVVSWPTGYQFLALAPVGPNGEELDDPPSAGWCPENPNNADDCRRRFDLNRQGIFHYLLYAHARGIPKSTFPCLLPGDPDADPPVPPVPTEFGADGSCGQLDPNPDFYTPKASSGVAEIPGRYLMVTLGLWDNFVGTERMQANTTLHELGHTLGLWHGGQTPTFTYNPATARANVFIQPNCKPGYLSIMSYLFQAASLVDDFGASHTRYSSDVFGLLSGQVNETSLFDAVLSPTPPYRTAWYAPLQPGTLGYALGVPAATKYCSGAPFDGVVAPPMGRLDAASASALIDWRGDGGATTGGLQDVNFDGKSSGQAAVLTGFNDWTGLRLNQVGAGRNLGGFSVGLGLDFGGLDFGGLDFGGLDFGGLDFGGLDFGGLDFGGLDFGGLDFGGLDFGGLDFGGLDFGGLDFGGLDGLDFGGLDFGGLDFGGLDFGGTELDYQDVIESGGGTSPNQLEACVLGGTGTTAGAPGYPACASASPFHRHRLDWDAPNVGTPSYYSGFRVWDDTDTAIAPTPGSEAVPVGVTPDGDTTILDDTEELPNDQRFIYFVRGFIDGELRGLSNFAVVTAQNDAPTTAVTALSYTRPSGAASLSANVAVDNPITDADSAAWVVVLRTNVPAGQGSLVLNPDGSFTYTPDGFVGTTSFTYVVNNGPWSGDPGVPLSPDSNEVTVTIGAPPPYGFNNVLNLPPPLNKTFKRGSNVTLKWQFTLDGIVVDSRDAEVTITVKGPGATGPAVSFTPQEPGHSSFKLPTASNGWTWQFNWQTVHPTTGTALPAGVYYVAISSGLTGQTFSKDPATGNDLTITLVK